MAQLANVNQLAPVVLSLLASVCLMVGLVVGLLGIKIWWFKHRLTFDQHATQNGAAAGSRQMPFSSTQRSRLGASSSSLQVDGAAQIHGVFRKRQEDEWDIERPAVLPPVRLSKSTSDLKLLTRAPTPNEESAVYAPSRPPPHSEAPRIPMRKRKELQSSTLEDLTPPTRAPPKPPQDSLDAFAAQFETIRITNGVAESEVTEPLLAAQPPPEALPERAPSPAILRADQESQPTKFIRARAPGVDADPKKLSQRRVTGFLPPDLDELRAMAAIDAVEVEHVEQPVVRGAEAIMLRSNQNAANGMEAATQRERNSYVEYEKVDEYEASLEYLLKKKWETVATVEPVEHRTDLQCPTVDRRVEAQPQVTLDLFGELEDTNVDQTVEHLWFKIEQNNEQSLDTNFRMIRHSYEMNEADILDVRQEATRSPQEAESVTTTPTGFGKSIDEDWDNFENLSVMASAEQIFEPRMEQIDVAAVERHTDRTTTQLDALFQNLEMPLQFEHAEEGATAIFSEVEVEGERDSEITEMKLPDYESLMAHDPSEFLLPDYEAAIQFESRLNPTKKAVNYVSSIEDLFDELHDDAVDDALAETHTDTAYITNIDELYEDLGIVHKPSVRFPTESYLDAKTDLTLKKVRESTTFGGWHKAGADGGLSVPQPAQRRTKTRMKVRFDMESSQYYQPDELEPESDTEKDDADSSNAPKPKQRTTRLFADAHNDEEEAPSSSRGRQKPILFASYLANHNEAFQNDSNQSELTDESWQAISRHRAMAKELQDSEEPSSLRELPRPAYRNPLAQVLNDNRPVAAARKTSSAAPASQSEARQLHLSSADCQHEAEA